MPSSRPAEAQRVLIRLLRQSRVLAGVSQEDMARSLALRQSDISKIERGVRGVDVMELRAWSQAVGVPFEEFARVLEDAWSQVEQLRAHLSPSAS